ncbi:MAG: hypothetical protein QOJ99_1711 [Bryobacterales bacterium]|jgi:hypothetical protein|nr:hypothetical protein [Bryobacterales bacterium]
MPGDAEREHIPEVLEMRPGLDRGRGWYRGGLRSASVRDALSLGHLVVVQFDSHADCRHSRWLEHSAG